mgnify:CR=1 FL=1
MLEKGKISQEPFIEILKTLEEAESANLVDWNAMNIASADKMNQPSSRMVLLKKISDKNNLLLIEDASQAAGALFQNKYSKLTQNQLIQPVHIS